MKHFQCAVLLALFGLIGGSEHALADVIPFFNTGVALDGSLLAPGSTDPNYTLIYSPGGAAYTATATTANAVWTPGTSTAGWISPGTSGDQGWPAGYYVYETTLDLTGYDASTAALSGMFAADNAVSIYLNRSHTASFSSTTTGFSSMTPFLINSGFVNGVNLVDFLVYNDSGPTGLMVDDTAADAQTPEPGSLLLLGTGMAAAAFQLVRRQRSVTG